MCCSYVAQTARDVELCVEPDFDQASGTQLAPSPAAICQVCQGYRRVRCGACRDGVVLVLGGQMECKACLGLGWKVCRWCTPGHSIT